ncbi:MAG: DUF3261 domain-containing protein [Candidatus Binatia bacterium]
MLRSRPVSRRLAPLLAVLVAVSSSGCSLVMETLFAARLYECRGFDAPLSVLAFSSRKELRARVRARHVDYDVPFVVESSSESLVLVGFTPLGTKSFTLVRKGDEVELENLIGPGLQVPPRNIMEDVLAMSLPSDCATTSEATVTRTIGEWEVRDTCHDNRPVRRALAHGAQPPGEEEMTVEYGGDAISVQQNRCRYRARYVLQASNPVTPVTPVDGEEGVAEE